MNNRLSIITINHNNGPGLERTIKSIGTQTYRDFEFIVVDGASTDNSGEIISQYADRITIQIIEPDRGIYHAMNKGLLCATGNYVLFINSGDELAEITVLYDAMNQVLDEDIISCNLLLVSDKSVLLKEYPANPTFKYLLHESLPHPATFIKRELFKITQGYDEKYKICGDWAFFIRVLCKHDASYKHLPIALSKFYLDGISSAPGNQELIRRERKQVIEEHFPRFTDLIAEWDENKEYRFIQQNSRLIRIAKWLGFLKPPEKNTL